MGGLPQAQYSVHSSANPSASGIKYDPLRYGLKPGKYRVKHFGHSTQWRTREAMACVGDSFEGNWRHALTPPARLRRAGALGPRCGAETSVGPRPRAPGGGRGASQRAPSSPAPPNCRDSDTPMVPLLFDALFPIIHVARFGLDVSRPAADTTIQQPRPPRAGAHNPSGSLIP